MTNIKNLYIVDINWINERLEKLEGVKTFLKSYGQETTDYQQGQIDGLKKLKGILIPAETVIDKVFGEN